jgi:hypothetical protein
LSSAADDNVPGHLRCAICLDAPSGNAQQCNNGHIFCGDNTHQVFKPFRRVQPGWNFGTALDNQGGLVTVEDVGCLSKLRASTRTERKVLLCPVCRTPLPEVGSVRVEFSLPTA